jgi:hypothetical protein
MPISRLTLIERIKRFLHSIEARHIEPGRWEGYCTKQALTALDDGNIEAAEAHMHLALTPPELRTADSLVGFSPESRPPTLAELQAELERITASATTAPR